MLMVDAAFTVIALPSAAAPPNSAVIPAVRDWVGVLSPGMRAADDDRGAGQGGNLGRPVPVCSREDAVGKSSLHVDRAAAVGYRCIAVPPRVGEQADECVIPTLGRSIRDPTCSPKHRWWRFRSTTEPGCRSNSRRWSLGRGRYRLRSRRLGPVVNERLYCVVARAAGHINLARRRNRGVGRPGLYVKPPVLAGGGIRDIDCCAIC